MNTKSHRFGGYLSRLRSDASGNTMAIVAAAMFPLTAIVGTAIDMSRVYMTGTRLQQACDAGALIGRKIQGTGEWTLEETTTTSSSPGTNGNGNGNGNSAAAQANKYFNANIKNGQFGAKNVTVNYVATDAGEVKGTATATVEMTLASMVGMPDKTLTVECEAIYDGSVSSADVMLVLDTTGSMGWDVDGNSRVCDSYGRNCTSIPVADQRITALKASVIDFHAKLAAKTSEDGRLRLGFMPFSSTVNVGKILHAENPAWMASEATYQSREWGYTTNQPSAWAAPTTTAGNPSGATNTQNGSWTTSTTAPSGYQLSPTASNNSSCTGRAAPSATTPVSNGASTYTTVSETTDPTTGVKTKQYYRTDYWRTTGYRYSWFNSNPRCRLQQRNTTYYTRTNLTDVSQPTEWQEQTVNGWRYKALPYDVSEFVAGNEVTTNTGSNGAAVQSEWNGCIEERDTVADSTFAPLSSLAFDLNIDLAPNSEETKWRPMWPTVAYHRTTTAEERISASAASSNSYSQASGGCPTQATKLAEMDADDVADYVNALQPTGNTYHDIGMIWGARFISPTGIFADDNVNLNAETPTERHIVFMTDGELAPSSSTYGAYGLEYLDQRITGGSNTQFSRHEGRFEAACRAARALNVTVWVIGFGTTLSDAMYRCAGDDPANKANAAHVFMANSAEELTESFNKVASRVGDLRLGR